MKILIKFIIFKTKQLIKESLNFIYDEIVKPITNLFNFVGFVIILFVAQIINEYKEFKAKR